VFCREPQVRGHLKNVYACLTVSTLVSGLAAWLGLSYPDVSLIQPGFLTQIGGVALLIGLMATRNSKQNQPMRMGMLAALAYCIGTFYPFFAPLLIDFKCKKIINNSRLHLLQR